MIKLNLSKEIENRHLQYFKDKILEKFNDCPVPIDVDKVPVVEELYTFIRDNFEKFAIGKPDILRKLAAEGNEIVNNNFDIELKDGKRLRVKLLKDFGYEIFSKTPKDITDIGLTTENFSENEKHAFRTWNAYHFVFLSKINVCPYCNRQYIMPIYSTVSENNRIYKLRADLDHFYPKSKYPYLSMSLYNLVPSCKFCNSSLKGNKEFTVFDANPYEDSFDEYFKFRYNLENEMISIETHEDSAGKIENALKFFQTELLYSYHKNVGRDMYRKREIYSDSYIEEILTNHKNFINENEIVELIYGFRLDTTELNNDVLLKLKKDLAEQFNIM